MFDTLYVTIVHVSSIHMIFSKIIMIKLRKYRLCGRWLYFPKHNTSRVCVCIQGWSVWAGVVPVHICRCMEFRTLFWYLIRRLTLRSSKVSKPQDLYLELSDRSEIWHAPRQYRYLCARQMSKRYEHFNTRSCACEALWDLTIRRLIGYWTRALVCSKE